MEKNSKPYTEPHDLRLAFASDFESFVVIRSQWYGTFAANKNWQNIDTVPGTLKIGVASNAEKTTTYTSSITFRVSYDTLENQIKLENWCNKGVSEGVVASYTTGGGQQKVNGSKTYPLKFTYSKVEGFDGYECTLTGVSTTHECFI